VSKLHKCRFNKKSILIPRVNTHLMEKHIRYVIDGYTTQKDLNVFNYVYIHRSIVVIENDHKKEERMEQRPKYMVG